MMRRKIAIILTVLMLHSNVALASVAKYDVSVGNDGATVKCYSVTNLTDGFLDAKRGKKSEIYEDFIGNVKQGGYVAFEDDKGKIVDYTYIVQQFLKSKQKGLKFNLDNVLNSAPSMNINNKKFINYDKIDVDYDSATGAPTVDDINNSTLTDEEKEQAKDIIEQQQGGHSHNSGSSASKEEIKDTASMIEESMKANMPIMTKQEIKDLNMEVTDGNYHEDIWSSVHNFDRNLNHISGVYSAMGIPNISDEDTKSLKTLDRRANTQNLIENKLSKDPRYNNLFDLDNYEDFEGMSIDFSNLNKVNHEDFPENELLAANTKQEFAKYGYNIVNGGEGYYNLAPSVCADKRLQHSFMWKPYLERDFIEEINKMRVAKGAKPLQYDVNLHAMARFSVKRSTMGYNHSMLTDVNTHDHNQSHFKFWANGSIPYWRPYRLRDTGWGFLIDGESRNVHNETRDHWIDKLEGNEKKIFNYDGKVHAMSDMDFIFDNANQWLDYLNTQYNKFYISRGKRDYYAPYCKKMDFNRDLLDPNLTKIGVGVLCELPVCNRDLNGATGFFIITE